MDASGTPHWKRMSSLSPVLKDAWAADVEASIRWFVNNGLLEDEMVGGGHTEANGRANGSYTWDRPHSCKLTERK